MEKLIYHQNNGWAFNAPDGSRYLFNPEMFAVYSTSGNQWRKLMYFCEDWNQLNILISMYDVYRSDTSIIREMCQLGLRGHITAMRKRLGKKIRQNKLPQYRAYRRYFNSEQPVPHQGVLMLDSGGFSFGDPARLRPLLKSPLPTIRRFSRIMLAIAKLETHKDWNVIRFTKLANIAQRLQLRVQLQLRPDIIITLDRVMNYEMPYWLKSRRIRFNLTCARTALQFYARTPNPKPLLFPVLHPLGPPYSRIGKDIGETEAENFYTRTFIIQLKYLLRAEKEIGVCFGGFAVGSLVPVRNFKFLHILARAISRAIDTMGASGRPLHAFGAGDNKAAILYEYGFSSFDTNVHVVKARNRQIYDPDIYEYKKMSLPSHCSCPVCSRHSAEELLENRPGVKEVATVLQSLHNFYTNHLAHLEKIRKKSIKADLTPV